jgi:hypothetical protein
MMDNSKKPFSGTKSTKEYSLIPIDKKKNKILTVMLEELLELDKDMKSFKKE